MVIGSNWHAAAAEINERHAGVERREAFEIPEGVCYLDGNSLGAMPRAAREAVEHALTDEWGKGLIRSWNTAGWISLPQRTGDRIAPLIGADVGTVIVADSTSLNLYKALHAALDLVPDRDTIITDADNFPTDLYIIDTVARQRGVRVLDVKREAMLNLLDERTAVMTLTHVDYRTSEMVDMKTMTLAAHAVGAVTVWDLAHSAGAVPVELGECDVDFAVGCGYKFLNGGPGAPAFAYVAPRLTGLARQPIEGWMGHGAPFAFSREYAPAVDRSQFLVGTPPILGMTGLFGALSVFEGIDMRRLHAKALDLAALFHDLADVYLVPRGFAVYSHRESSMRGSHVALSHDDGYAIVQALIARGVIGDFRRPNVLRFGFAPLYNNASDVLHLVEQLIDVVDAEAFRGFEGESAVV